MDGKKSEKSPLDELFLPEGNYMINTEMWNKIIAILKSHKGMLLKLQADLKPITITDSKDGEAPTENIVVLVFENSVEAAFLNQKLAKEYQEKYNIQKAEIYTVALYKEIPKRA